MSEDDPSLVRLSVFRERRFTAVLVAAFVPGVGPQGVLFFLSVYLQAVRGWTPLEVGVGLLPPAIVAPVGVAAAVRLIRMAGLRPPLVTGLATMGAAFVILARIPDEAAYVTDLLPRLLLVGLGATLTSVPMYVGALASSRPDELGSRSGLLYSSQYLGPALLLTIMTLALRRTGIDVAGVRSAFAVGAMFLLAAAAAVLCVDTNRRGKAKPTWGPDTKVR